MFHFSSSFGLHKNMSYNFGDYSEVKSNVDSFLKNNNFSSQDKLVTSIPVHKNRFVFLDQNLFQTLEGKDYPFRSIDADGVISNLRNTPIAFKPADCAVVGFEFSSSLDKGRCPDCGTEGFVGLLHIGFDDYLKGVISEFNNFIVGKGKWSLRLSKCDLSLQICKIHVFPFLQKYRIDYGDFHSDKYDWEKLNKIQGFIEEDENGKFVNFHKVIYTELVKVFGEELLDWSKVRDTSTGSVQGTGELVKGASIHSSNDEHSAPRGFSHSLSHFHPEFENGREIVVGEINY